MDGVEGLSGWRSGIKLRGYCAWHRNLIIRELVIGSNVSRDLEAVIPFTYVERMGHIMTHEQEAPDDPPVFPALPG